MRGEDLPLKYRLLLKAYPWRRTQPVPRAELRRPLSRASVGLVTTAGLVPPGAEPFDLGRRGGDPTFRVLSAETPPRALTVYHRSDSFDREALAEDSNVVYPTDVLARFAAEGRIGRLAPRHLSFMGSITAPLRLIREEAPRAVEVFTNDQVDVALLVPV
ncbi:MAG: glycine/betaine/sarcosine/D-proline family reductase selenoprotein B [Acidobacteriota bacterium]|nr:glycine/betaine/sarcosine/D-proline family reductase selenoprotein B [Acidobacteriota bacterium]